MSNHKWSYEDIQVLKTKYKTLTDMQLVKLFHNKYTLDAVRAKRRRLGHKKQKQKRRGQLKCS